MYKKMKFSALSLFSLFVLVAAMAFVAMPALAHDNSANANTGAAGGVESMAMGNGISGALVASQATAGAQSLTTYSGYGWSSSAMSGSEGSAGSGSFALGNAAAGGGAMYDADASASAENGFYFGW